MSEIPIRSPGERHTYISTEDYRHDVYDVTTGSIIGAMVAIYSYVRGLPRTQLYYYSHSHNIFTLTVLYQRRYFPPLTSPNAGIAYASRIHDETPEEGFEALDSPDLELGNVPHFDVR